VLAVEDANGLSMLNTLHVTDSAGTGAAVEPVLDTAGELSAALADTPEVGTAAAEVLVELGAVESVIDASVDLIGACCSECAAAATSTSDLPVPAAFDRPDGCAILRA